ncbi:MAG TPA: hypothetical protein VKB67_15005 [Rhizomicrobium sp.]|nr:hypothetical protein [Rhizomicrobium sp.]
MRERSWISIAIAAAIVFAIGFATLASATGWNGSLVFGLGLAVGIAGLNVARKFWNRPRKPRH